MPEPARRSKRFGRAPRPAPVQPSARTERLNAAIDRLLAGNAATIDDDPDLQDLLHLASRLHVELPRDLPDPAFRAGLKSQLTEPLPAVTRPRRSEPAPARFPYLAAAGAIVAVLVAAMTVGGVGVWLGGEDGDSDLPAAVGSVVTGDVFGQPRTALATGTVLDASAVGFVTATPGSLGQSPVATLTVSRSTSSVPAATATPPPARGGASIPPVNATTINTGLGLMAQGGGTTPSDAVRYELALELPDLATTAPAYWFAPPDPESLLRSLMTRLDLEGEVVVNEVLGNHDYSVQDAAGRNLRCIAESGAIVYNAPDDPDAADADPLDRDAAVERARAWLEQIDYPVEHLDPDARAAALGDGQWVVEFVFAALPQPGIGHPVGITMTVNQAGDVTNASGYWLAPRDPEEMALISAAEAWAAVQRGEGYWRDGGMSAEGGALRVDAVSIAWVLTVNPTDELILQPVIQLDGDFTTADGRTTSRVSIFVRAVKAAT